MTAVPWRNASTLIIAARNQLGMSKGRSSFADFHFDYKVMMLKRSAKSNFFAKAYVFPGGATDSTDFCPSWFALFDRHGFSKERLLHDFATRQEQLRLPLYKTIPSTDLIAEVGYRITAIRETFEETGVLFCLPACPNSTTVLKGNLENWRCKVQEDPEQFIKLCIDHNIYPDVWSLYEWSNWLTPANMGPKRYDTIFYICIIDQIPQVQVDNKEITDLLWIDPVESVWKHVQTQIWLAPPQIYELSRLSHFSYCEQLKDFASQRQKLGTEHWLPVRMATDTGITTILPGDSSYPGCAPAEDVSCKLNRMNFSSPITCQISCNIEDPYGHKQPIDLISRMEKEKLPHL